MEKHQVLDALFKLGFKLGGSRRMASKYPTQVKVTDETDWDLYTDDLPHRRDELLSMGFERLDCPNKSYWDDLLVDIFKHPNYAIEVLLRKQVDVYTKTFEGISAEFFISDLWKSAPHNSEIEKPIFAAKVCHTFNRLFRAHGL